MRTNVSIELDDEARQKLACMIAGKATSKLATRAQIVAVCQQHIAGLVEECSTFDSDVEQCPDCGRKASICVDTVSDCRLSPNNLDKVRVLSTPDPEDVSLLRGKSASYIYGWNKVKRGSKS